MKFSFKGLDDGSVESSRRQFGSNALSPQESEGFWDKLWDNFKDPTIVILTVALVIVTVLAFFDYAEWYEGIGIAIAVFIATMVATWSEFKNENTFQRLLEDASRIQVKVFRNSGSKQVNIDELVVGDLVLLQPGDKIPADGVLVAGDLRMDQAVLNGELEHVSKRAISDDVPRPPTGNLDDENWVFRGTVVADGEAVMELVSVGDRTFYGRLAGELSAAERDSPLKVKLKKLADDISKFGTIGAILIAIAFMFQKLFMQRGLSFDTLWPYLAELSNWPALFGDAVTAVILAVVIIVVAVPEGLPMMVAIVLSLNMRKLLNDKVLVRKLLGIETAGSLNVLFSDKTGTLTKGELRASVFVTGDGNSSDSFAALSEPLRRLVGRSLKYNTIAVIDTSHGEQVKLIGADRTERALLQYVETILRDDENIGVVNEISFNGERKFSAVQLEGEFEKTLVKGAPEILLGECTHYYDEGGQVRELTDLSALNSAMASLAARSMRLLALATSDVRIDGDKKMPTPLTLVGIVALGEELRAESPQAVRQAHAAGIQVVMVTGDHKETAQAIAREVGLLNRDDAVVLTSAELDELTDEQLREMMPRLHVVARAYPHQKSRLVQAAQDLNLVGGMTGDGVNDAAALKRADVGFSMGSGTEVSKEAGDIVILDDNFSSLTRAVLYGRTLFKSIRKFLVFQLTVNVSAILVAFFGPFFGFDLPLTMIQLLWVNLIMDTLAALAFSGEAPLERYMQERPIPRDAPLISADMWSSILFNGIVISILSIGFLIYTPIRELFRNEAAFMTGFFAFFVFIHNFNKFNARTERKNLFEHILKNRGFLAVVTTIFVVQVIFTYYGGEVLRTVGLTFGEWLLILAMSFVIIPLDLARKTVRDVIAGKLPATT